MEGAPFNLTFGAELEFVVTYNPEDYKDDLLAMNQPMDRDSVLIPIHGILVSRHMIRILNENGFPTNDFESKDFSKWTVESDNSISPADSSQNWYGIELKTPVLHGSRPSLEKVTAVVELLVSNFDLYVNGSCGLHVHVGNEDRGFTLPTLKNFCSLITVFGHQLDSLHPRERIQNPYAKSTRRVFSPEAPLKEMLSIIGKLETVEDLISKFHTTDGDECIHGQVFNNKYMAFNFFNLRESGEPLRTIEFRQHRGTLDPKLIIHWIMVACNLVHQSYTDDGTAAFGHLFEEHIDDTNYTVVDLFNDLKLSGLARFYAPLLFPRPCTDESLATMSESIEDQETGFMVFPGSYDTPWEKEFTPRPPWELKPYWVTP